MRKRACADPYRSLPRPGSPPQSASARPVWTNDSRDGLLSPAQRTHLMRTSAFVLRLHTCPNQSKRNLISHVLLVEVHPCTQNSKHGTPNCAQATQSLDQPFDQIEFICVISNGRTVNDPKPYLPPLLAPSKAPAAAATLLAHPPS